ncbi:uncharacterized protein K444DRAFT_626991 [Hyaloscypha bicolor E]|uniref:Uncharacterized protein n=1 Tax=Hyaloscypha bicolor E TaxID=1095630 RepID=A0A2J6TJS9_9HELO|nr:uncharacterized protein K444DRAFT_626991 [Hyaloscypha bicolor E]PMD63260.1 hypothetical protein K444DRAFT_626991 [Hyaloscypha bicolor E]
MALGDGAVEVTTARLDEFVFSEKEPLRRLDEYEIDFDDARDFFTGRWQDIVTTATDRLTVSDHQTASKYHDWQDLASEIAVKLAETPSNSFVKRHMIKIQPLPHVLTTFTRKFSNIMIPSIVDFELLWGLIYLNLKLSYGLEETIKRTTDLLHSIRRLVELFTRCLDVCDKQSEAEARIAAIDFLDPLLYALTDSIDYLHGPSESNRGSWPDLKDSISAQLRTMDSTVKHLNEITINTRVNLDLQVKNMSQRYALTAEPDEPGTFPNKILPFQLNQNFYGRKDELEKIYEHLKPKNDKSYRTYTIYGRRGVGKTEIALQFAYSNPAGYDAVFWVQCETSVAIRQSFTDIAVALELPGAQKDGHHEENLMAVKEWLKRTKRRWLLIFDNAENALILKAYWPTQGTSGAILLTSRKYYNFQNMGRKGDTVKPFDSKQSWELLLQLLGPEWQRQDREMKIPQSEITAAKAMLAMLEGLALAIQQAANLIRDDNIGGPTISRTFEVFKERIRTLPERYSSARSSAERALDALWDMNFSLLSKNAKVLLGVFAWLPPDKIPVELFLPTVQSILDGPLEFCKQDAKHIDENNRVALADVIDPSPQLLKAIEELLEKSLVKRDGRNLSVHRVVQEATTYGDLNDLQTSFDATTRLVHYRFPKTEMDGSLFLEWSICQEYIPHGVNLSKRFTEHTRAGALKGSVTLVELMSNCAWYLHELGDYEVSGQVLDTAVSACENRDSLLYAELRSTAGSRFYDLNKLGVCRKAWDEALAIRKSFLPQNNPSVAAIQNNLGNVELATGNPEDALRCFNLAIPIWKAGGDKTATHLALSYLCVGRVYMFQGKLTEALRMTSQSDTLFMRTTGGDRGFMANVHYAYGNIHFRQKNWAYALRDYESCLKIGLASMPIHPITAAAYFSIAGVELQQKNIENAK